MAKVLLKNISKIFSGDIKAIENLTLEIKDKEFLVLVGPSGCGKSTTLRMIAGLETITSGEIYIDDVLVNNVHPKDRDIAMVFQNYALYPHMNVYDNLAFGLKLRKYPREEIDRRVKEAAELLGIQDILSRKPSQISGGQRQRVAVGRAIVRKPKVFLFDEPLSNLDAKMRVLMRKELSMLHKRLKTTMIYVTHDQIEAMTMGTRIAVMNKGVIQQIADPITLYNKPENMFVASFIGSPPMNFIKGFIVRGEDGLYFKGDNFKVKIAESMVGKLSKYKGKEIIMGIRPEDIYDKLFFQGLAEHNTINATVENVEPMGHLIYLYLSVGEHKLIASVDSREEMAINQEIEVVLDMTKAHFFDRDTGKSIF